MDRVVRLFLSNAVAKLENGVWAFLLWSQDGEKFFKWSEEWTLAKSICWRRPCDTTERPTAPTKWCSLGCAWVKHVWFYQRQKQRCVYEWRKARERETGNHLARTHAHILLVSAADPWANRNNLANNSLHPKSLLTRQKPGPAKTILWYQRCIDSDVLTQRLCTMVCFQSLKITDFDF